MDYVGQLQQKYNSFFWDFILYLTRQNLFDSLPFKEFTNTSIITHYPTRILTGRGGKRDCIIKHFNLKYILPR